MYAECCGGGGDPVCHHDGVGHIESKGATSLFTSIIVYMWRYWDCVSPPKKEIVFLLLLGDSNFQFFSQNCQFHHRRLVSLGHLHVLLYHS